MPDLTIRHEVRNEAGHTLTPTTIFEPVTLSLTNGTVYRTSVVIPDAYGTDVVWQTGGGGFDSFELGLIVSNQDLALEFRTDAGTAGYATTLLKANVPYYFSPKLGTANAATLDGDELVDDTDYNDVDRISVQRNVADNQGDALVRLWLFA